MSLDNIDRAACPLNSSIPHPKVVFHNVRSLSLYPSQTKDHARHNRVIRHVTSLTKAADIVCLQETQAATDERLALSLEFGQTHVIFYNKLRKGRAGVITMVSRRFTSGFCITQPLLDPSLAGRALILDFNSKLFPGCERASFSCVNIYLTSGNHTSQRLLELETMVPLLDPKRVIFFGGDFNMVDCPDDRAGSSENILNNYKLEGWRSFLDKL